MLILDEKKKTTHCYIKNNCQLSYFPPIKINWLVDDKLIKLIINC